MTNSKGYTDTLYYQLRLTARYMKLFGVQLFKSLGITIDVSEFVVLDLVLKNPGLCQRDLAKLLFKDRANTGRLTSALEKKGLLEIKLGKRYNRPVNFLVLSELGRQVFDDVMSKFEPKIKEISKVFSEKDEERLIDILKEFRGKLDSVLEVRI